MSASQIEARIHISDHAILRYRQRVAPGASFREARQAIEEIVRRGHSVEKPRHWMREHTQQTSAKRYVHWCERPGVCLIVVGNTVATVYAREICRDWPPRSRAREHPEQYDGRLGSNPRTCRRRRPRRQRRAERFAA